MVRVIKTTPSLRRVIERELIIQNRNSKENGKENCHNCHEKENRKENRPALLENIPYASGPLEKMIYVALKGACNQLGVRYW